VPTRNVLSFTEPNRPTVDHQWLFQLALYGAERAGGIPFAIVVKALLVAGAFGLACASALGGRARPGVALVVVVLAACAARFRFTLRPHVVSFLLLSSYLTAIRLWQRGRPRWLLALPPLQVLWANVHGGASVLGFGVLLLYALGETVSGLASRRWGLGEETNDRLGWLWGMGAACLVATLLNPFGARVLALPFTHAFAQAASGLKPLLRDRSGVTLAELGGRHLLFGLLGLAVVVSVAVEAVRLRLAHSVLLLGLLAAAFTSERFIGVLAIAAAHLAPGDLSLVTERLGSGFAARRGVGFFGAAVLSCALAGVAIFITGGEQPMGLGVAPGRFPEREVRLAAERYPTARLFNEFEDGGYIHWHTRRPVFVDSRGLLAYSPRFMLDYVAAWGSRARWEAVLARYDIEAAVVWRPPLKAMFRSSPQWEEVLVGPDAGDGRHAFFVRRHPPAPTPGAAGAP